MSENQEIVLIESALQNFDRVAAGLSLLEKNYKNVLFDVETPLGLAHAKAARAAIREPRYEVERLRKGAKAPLLALGKRLDAEATRITNALMTLEVPIVRQIDELEARKEAEKQATAAAEAKRIADIQARIDQMRNMAAELAGFPSALITDYLDGVIATVIDESFAEFQQIASDAKGATVGRLSQLRDAAIAQEAEAARIKAERAELAKLRAEQKERDRIMRTEHEAEAAKVAEQQRLERLENERIAAESRAKFEQEECTAKAIRDAEEARIAREASDLAKAQKEFQAMQNAPEPIDLHSMIAATPQPFGSRYEIIMLVANFYDTSKDQALALLRSIDWN